MDRMMDALPRGVECGAWSGVECGECRVECGGCGVSSVECVEYECGVWIVEY